MLGWPQNAQELSQQNPTISDHFRRTPSPPSKLNKLRMCIDDGRSDSACPTVRPTQAGATVSSGAPSLANRLMTLIAANWLCRFSVSTINGRDCRLIGLRRCNAVDQAGLNCPPFRPDTGVSWRS
jgi:hypothetical protein